MLILFRGNTLEPKAEDLPDQTQRREDEARYGGEDLVQQLPAGLAKIQRTQANAGPGRVRLQQEGLGVWQQVENSAQQPTQPPVLQRDRRYFLLYSVFGNKHEVANVVNQKIIQKYQQLMQFINVVD